MTHIYIIHIDDYINTVDRQIDRLKNKQDFIW